MAAMSSSAAVSSSTATLSEILNVEPDLLQEKFDLQPHHSYDPQEKDNLVFLSPTVLLEDLKLREGGWKDRGAKEVLGLLAKDILKSKDHTLFQVPEITYFHMGYGKRSPNKKNSMAILETEAKAWMKVFDLAEWKANSPFADDNDEVMIDDQREGETAMDIDFTFPTPEDTQALDEFDEDVDPSLSGLKIKVKSRYLLFFSILLIFYKKKLKETSANEDKIGANKISDFLLFWILPYMLNFTEQQVNSVNKHHEVESKKKGVPEFSVPVVQMSAMDIIKDAFKSCKVSKQLEETLLTRYKKYYGTDQLERKYSLPAVAVRENEPVILIPLCYQVTNMPVEIENIGRTWREIGNIDLVDEFINKVIGSRKIQEDFLYEALKDLEDKEKCAVDYGILLPNENTFAELVTKIEAEHPDLFRDFKCIKKQGRDFITPKLGLVKNGGKKPVSVIFSYFQGNNSENVATLFRMTGAHRLNHFTLAVLHGSCVNPYDPKCKLLSLYPVTSAQKFELKQGRLRKCKVGGTNEGNSQEGFLKGKFCKIEFPGTLLSFNQKVDEDNDIRKAISNSGGKLEHPRFENQYPVTVAYTTASQSCKLKKNVLGAAVARIKKLKKYQVRAANLEGCLLYMIARSACKGNLAVVLAINDTLEPYGALLPFLPTAMEKTLSYFIMAVVVAGLPKVYPAEGSSSARDVEAGTDDEDDSDSDSDDDDDLDLPSTSGATNQPPAATPCTVSPKLQIKPSKPSVQELNCLAARIVPEWYKLGIQLGINDDKLKAIRKEEDNPSYEMLCHWTKIKTSEATYGVLYEALRHLPTSRVDLAEEFCCLPVQYIVG